MPPSFFSTFPHLVVAGFASAPAVSLPGPVATATCFDFVPAALSSFACVAQLASSELVANAKAHFVPVEIAFELDNLEEGVEKHVYVQMSVFLLSG